jgi:hypothetical protein
MSTILAQPSAATGRSSAGVASTARPEVQALSSTATPSGSPVDTPAGPAAQIDESMQLKLSENVRHLGHFTGMTTVQVRAMTLVDPTAAPARPMMETTSKQVRTIPATTQPQRNLLGRMWDAFTSRVKGFFSAARQAPASTAPTASAAGALAPPRSPQTVLPDLTPLQRFELIRSSPKLFDRLLKNAELNSRDNELRLLDAVCAYQSTAIRSAEGFQDILDRVKLPGAAANIGESLLQRLDEAARAPFDEAKTDDLVYRLKRAVLEMIDASVVDGGIIDAELVPLHRAASGKA